MSVASTSSRSDTPKLCPRCGAFYQDLASKTCPQCFAKLEPLTDEEAAGLIDEQELRSRDPEHLQAKDAEDEVFKQQSFGACFGVGLALIALVVLSAGLITIALHRQISPQGPLVLLPADFNSVIPTTLKGDKRVSADADVTMTDGGGRVYHGVYSGGEQIYALPGLGINKSQAEALRLGAELVARQQAPPGVQQEIERSVANYEVIGHSAESVQAAAKALPR